MSWGGRSTPSPLLILGHWFTSMHTTNLYIIHMHVAHVGGKDKAQTPVNIGSHKIGYVYYKGVLTGSTRVVPTSLGTLRLSSSASIMSLISSTDSPE